MQVYLLMSSMSWWAADTLAVLDATRSERAVVMGTARFATAAILLAATHPERTQALVLINAFARTVRTPEYPVGVPTAVFESFFEGPCPLGLRCRHRWGSRRVLDRDPSCARVASAAGRRVVH